MSALRKLRHDCELADVTAGTAFARRLLESVWPTDVETAPALLWLSDLIPDSGREVVLRPGGLDRRFRVLVPFLPLESGRALPHITAAGENVTGLHFVRFENGLTLYYPPDVELEFVLVTD